MFSRLVQRYWKVFLLFLTAPLCFALICALYYCHLILSSKSDLSKAIEEANRLDPGWTLKDLENSRGVLSDEENCALEVLKVDRLIPKKWWEFKENQPASLEMVKAALLEAHKLARYEKGRFPFKPSKTSLLGPTLSGSVYRVAFLLDYEAQDLSNKSKTEQAIVSCRAMLGAVRSIGDEPSNLSQTLRNHIRQSSVKCVERNLGRGVTSEATLEKLQKELEIEEKQPLLLIMARAERASWHEFLQSCEQGDVPLERLIGPSSELGLDSILLAKPMLPHSHAWIIRYFNEFVEICKEATQKQKPKIEALAASITNASPQVKLVFAEIPLSSIREVNGILIGRGLLRCAITALACERFRLKNSRWPKGLPELVPDYIQELPSDPINGGSIEARILKDRMVVYFPKLREIGALDPNIEDSTESEGPQVSFTLWSASEREKPERRN